MASQGGATAALLDAASALVDWFRGRTFSSCRDSQVATILELTSIANKDLLLEVAHRLGAAQDSIHLTDTHGVPNVDKRCNIFRRKQRRPCPSTSL